MKKELNFAVSDSSAIPYDLDTYRFLCSHSIFSTKINVNYLPSIGDLFGYSIKQIPLQKVFDTAMKKTQSFWINPEDNTFKITFKDKDCFVLVGSLSKESKEKLKKIETAWRNFFARWGYHSSFMYDETQTRCKMTIRYEFSSQPEIKIAEEPEQQKLDVKMILGGVLEVSIMKYDDKEYIHIEDAFAKKTLYNLRLSVVDSGMIAKLIDIANASSK